MAKKRKVSPNDLDCVAKPTRPGQLAWFERLPDDELEVLTSYAEMLIRGEFSVIRNRAELFAALKAKGLLPDSVKRQAFNHWFVALESAAEGRTK